ncbi:MAG: BLUF domain-containing protein [Rhodospirillales bacterium]|nr:BLUF domain-containing protein [Rhodospirillales bacterium]MBO6786279.1 BLUF domain-containing protein [Rhodospirillales bacterium]
MRAVLATPTRFRSYQEGNVAIRQILYASQTDGPVSERECQDILATSRRNNERDGISGLLVYISNGTFLQVLEGPGAAIENAMSRIKDDARHYDVAVLIDRQRPAPHFTDWSMGYKTFHAAQLADFAGFKRIKNVNELKDLLPAGDAIFSVMTSIYDANRQY